MTRSLTVGLGSSCLREHDPPRMEKNDASISGNCARLLHSGIAFWRDDYPDAIPRCGEERGLSRGQPYGGFWRATGGGVPDLDRAENPDGGVAVRSSKRGVERRHQRSEEHTSELQS